MTLDRFKIQNFQFKLFMTFLAICPVFFCGWKQLGWSTLRLGQEQIFQFGITILIGFFLIENIYLAALLLLGCFSYVYYMFPPNGGNILINLIFFCFLYQIAYKVITRENFEKVKGLILWLLAIDIGYMALQKVGLDFIYLSHSEHTYSVELVGLMGLKAINGMFIALCIPFLMDRNFFIGCLMLFPIFLTESSTAMAAGCSVISLFMIIRARHYRIFMLSILAVMSVIAISYACYDQRQNFWTDRVDCWKVSLRDAAKRPIVGWGMDSFRSVGAIKPFMYFKNVSNNKTTAFAYNKEINGFIPPKGFVKAGDIVDPWDHPHNEYVMLLYELGILGAIWFIAFIKDICDRFRYCHYDLKDEITPIFLYFVALLILSIGQFPFHLTRIVYMVPVMLAAYYKFTEIE